MPMQGITVVN